LAGVDECVSSDGWLDRWDGRTERQTDEELEGWMNMLCSL
jgi:hypothetical protein